MIRKLEVEGLNNRIDASLGFNEDLNIITGRNGSGKTTLLKLIWYLISGNLERIIPEILFQSASIETDLFSLSIVQVESDKGKLECKFANERSVVVDFEIPLRIDSIEGIERLNRRIARAMDSSLFFPTFRRIEGGFSRSRYIVDDDSVTYRDRLRGRFGDRTTEHLQEAMSRLSTEVSVLNHKFIASISTHDIVELLTEKYADVSEKTNELHVKLSKEITQQISERNPEDTTAVLEGIQKRVEQVNEERDLLLKPFSVLAERIRDIFQYKGIRVTAGITLGEVNEAIASDKLSAGEKQMLSFLCYNTFSENAAIFIDEPELSLHVDWQRRLIPTLLEQETGNQFFIATHSPFIYAKYPDKEILLGEERRRRLMPVPHPTVNELVETLRRSELPTVVVEGENDMQIYRWVEARVGSQNANVLPAGGRKTLLSVYKRRTEYAHLPVAFVADRDLWLFSGIPPDYPDIIWTEGYSIENDLYAGAELEKLLDSDEAVEHQQVLDSIIEWFAFEVEEYLAGRPAQVNTHCNRVVPPGQTKRDPGFCTHRGFRFHPKRIQQIKNGYQLQLRGKSLFEMLHRFLDAAGRPVRHNFPGLYEIAVKMASSHRLMNRLIQEIEMRLR